MKMLSCPYRTESIPAIKEDFEAILRLLEEILPENLDNLAGIVSFIKEIMQLLHLYAPNTGG